MKKFTVLFLLLCFLTVAFSGLAFANADNSQDIKIAQPANNSDAAQNFNIDQKKPSFWVEHRYTIWSIFAGIAIYNHYHHHHNHNGTAAPVIN